MTAMAGLALYANSFKPSLPATPDECVLLPSDTKLGPALAISQAEELSLAKLKAAPSSVPRVPFGHLNSEWVALKQLARPGDTVHEFSTDISGGYLILRQKCLVGQLPTWIR
jgi:hypothetical protein